MFIKVHQIAVLLMNLLLNMQSCTVMTTCCIPQQTKKTKQTNKQKQIQTTLFHCLIKALYSMLNVYVVPGSNFLKILWSPRRYK
jgi:hypothetical protein